MEPYWLKMQSICVIHGEILAVSGGEPGRPNEGDLELLKTCQLLHS